MELYNPQPSNVYIFILVLSEGQAGENWKLSKAMMLILSPRKYCLSCLPCFPFHTYTLYGVLRLSLSCIIPKPRRKPKIPVVVKKTNLKFSKHGRMLVSRNN